MSDVRTLAIDIGGTGLKMLVLDEIGAPVTERTRVLTPRPAAPAAVIDALASKLAEHGAVDRVAVGFPGVVVEGVVKTAPNLSDVDWRGFDLASALADLIDAPVRVANDADVQGLGVIEGHGVELVLTLGTGCGSGLFVDGKLVPNLELGHHRFNARGTYEDNLGKPALRAIGKKRWNRRLARAIEHLDTVFNYRVLYLGGGHAKKVRLDLPANVKIVDNLAGLLGGIRLWS